MTKRILRGPALLLAAGVLGSCGGDTTGTKTPGPPARMEVVSGDVQKAEAGTQLTSPLVVRVMDASEQPVPGQIVNFVVVKGGGSVFAPAAQTNAQGIAQNLWTLGTSSTDSQVVEVRAVDPNTGAPLVFARFSARATAGAAVQLSKVSGDNQVGYTYTNQPDSLVVKVADKYGNGVAGAVVTWGTTYAGASMSPETSQTDTLGLAKSLWKLGTSSTEKATATFSGASVEFNALVAPSPAAIIEKVSGDNQIGVVARVLAEMLTVVVRMPTGEVLPNVVVAFAAVGAGRVHSPQPITDANGRASAAAELGTVAGPTSFEATILQSTRTVFNAVARPGDPVTFTAWPQSSTFVIGKGTYAPTVSGPVETPLADSPAVKVSDVYGNGVSGLRIRWSPVWGTATPSIATTGENGIAKPEWRLGTLVGGGPLYQRLKATWELGPDSVIHTADGSTSLEINFRPSASDSTYSTADTVYVVVSASSPNGAITAVKFGAQATGATLLGNRHYPPSFVPPGEQVGLVFSDGAWRGKMSTSSLSFDWNWHVLATVTDAAGKSATFTYRVRCGSTSCYTGR